MFDMAFTYVGSTRHDLSASTTNDLAPHASTAEGDILLALVHSWYMNPSSTPANWYLLGNHSLGAGPNHNLYWRLVPAGGVGSTTWTFPNAYGSTVLISTFRGFFLASSPIDVVSNTQYIVNDSTSRAAAMTITGDYAAVVCMGAIYDGDSVNSYTPPGGFAERYEALVALNHQRMEVASAILPNGTTGDLDFNIGATSAYYGRKHMFAVALNRYMGRVVGGTKVSLTVVDIEFDTVVDEITAEIDTNWTVTKDGGGSVPAFTPTMQVGGGVVQLVFASDLAGSYTIEATAVLDYEGRAFDPAHDTASVAVLSPGGGLRCQAWMF